MIALIAGIRGQDGSYLAEKLLYNGWSVIGITRGGPVSMGNIDHIIDHIKLTTSDYSENDILNIVKHTHPNVIFNLAGQTYVSKSWDMLDLTMQSAAVIPTYFLNAILKIDNTIRYFQASSSEIYQPTNNLLTEASPMGPVNPYGCSKAFSQYMVRAYRLRHQVHASTGILFNHESPRRANDFLSRKVVREAVKIKKGLITTLELGNLDITRDWGYAPDYILAIISLMELSQPEDINICTGIAHTVRDFAKTTLQCLNLDTNLIHSNKELHRVYEPAIVVGSNEKAQKLINWQPTTTFKEMIQIMVNHELESCN